MLSRPHTALGVSHYEDSKPVHFENYDNVPLGECAICLGDIGSHHTLHETPCGHCFHYGCLLYYCYDRFRARTEALCPMCRAGITAKFRTPYSLDGIQGPLTLWTLADPFGNGHTYGIVDIQGGCFGPVDLDPRPKRLARVRPHLNVQTVRINPYAGWVRRGAVDVERV